jgi:hypothetical protein
VDWRVCFDCNYQLSQRPPQALGGGSYSAYLLSHNLNAMGMSRNCFKEIWYTVQWSRQPPEQPVGMSSEQYRWMLVDNFVENINAYCQRTYFPGNHLEADKTVIRWYGARGGLRQQRPPNVPCARAQA